MLKQIKKSFKFIYLLLLSFCLFACGENPKEDLLKERDFVSELKLDFTSNTLKEEVTVENYIDGDTTHFNVSKSVNETGVLKARYLAINTPESTGKIEEWGKLASHFTKEKLQSAISIIIESDDDNWNLDSTGARYLVWVWYKTSEDSEYRNLNVEILQNGLAIASNSSGNRYGEICVSAIDQARKQKLYVYSNEKDPDFYYGGAIEVTLKEIRTNIKEYENVKVAFEGVITKNYNNSIYVEEYDAETDMYYGIMVYLGYGLPGEGLEIVNVGNRSRIVGTVQYYETGGTYQVSGLQYRVMKPDDPNNVKLISTGHTGAYCEINANDFANGKVSIETNDEMKEFSYAELIMNTTVSMKNLVVKDVYTTKNEDSSSYGAMTLTCSVDGITIYIRTVVFSSGEGESVNEDTYKNKTIDVNGIVDYYNGNYQIKVFNAKDILIH